MASDDRRLTIVQYAGDVREASQRLRSGGTENYGGQRYTVEYVEALASRLGSVTTITGFTSEAYDCVLPSGMHAIGAGFSSGFDSRKILDLLKQTSPDLVILRSPLWRVLLWSIMARRRTLLMLADSFHTGSWKGRLKIRLLAVLLRSSVFDVVANHGRRSAEQLAEAGVPAGKVLAWDYPPLATPDDRPAKAAPSGARRVLFVGTMSTEKGVYDLIDAAGLLKDRGAAVNLDLVGTGDIAQLTKIVADKNLGDVVHVVGPVSNPEVLERMTNADVVVVPSRYEYPEGVPLTIYEAYCSRTPLIASDHPMFVGNVIPEESGLMFPAGRPDALAAQIDRLLGDQSLYRNISEASKLAWQRLQNPVKWGDLIDRWLEDSTESRAWIAENSIGALSLKALNADS